MKEKMSHFMAIHGFPTWEYDGVVHPENWLSSITPVDIKFGY